MNTVGPRGGDGCREAVDTHIFRVANRTRLALGKTPLEVEGKLEAITPAEYKRYVHHWLILHGRYVCKARKPECADRVVSDLCRYGAKTGPVELIAAQVGSGEPEALTEPSSSKPRPRAKRPGETPGQLATRTLVTSAMTSPGSEDGCAWTSPDICPPHSISIWP